MVARFFEVGTTKSRAQLGHSTSDPPLSILAETLWLQEEHRKLSVIQVSLSLPPNTQAQRPRQPQNSNALANHQRCRGPLQRLVRQLLLKRSRTPETKSPRNLLRQAPLPPMILARVRRNGKSSRERRQISPVRPGGRQKVMEQKETRESTSLFGAAFGAEQGKMSQETGNRLPASQKEPYSYQRTTKTFEIPVTVAEHPSSAAAATAES
jgi:hypothetical protein